MSKFVKDLITKDLRKRLDGVSEALLVDVIGLENNKNILLRQRLRQKKIKLLVVKNSLARRATEGTALAPAFETAEGTLAIVWGGEDIVSLAKEVVGVKKDKKFEDFETRGGVMDGAKLSADDVAKVSKWPSRTEQLSLLMGQVMSPGMTLSAQLLGPGASLGSQIKQVGEGDES